MLKRLIVIMAVTALVAGAAFAEASLGGQLMIGTTLLSGDSAAKMDDDSALITMGGQQFHEAKMSATFGDARGGGVLKFTVGNDNAYGGGMGLEWKTAWGFLYWRPSEYFKIQVGKNADGDFGAAQISGWGFIGEAKNSVAAISDYMNWGDSNTFWPLWPFQSASRKGSAFYGGTGDPGINLSFFPTDGMQINVVIPMADGNPLEFSEQISDFQFNWKYNIEGAGLVSLAFQGKGGLAKDALDKKSVGNIYASFYLSALEALKAELGIVYGLPWQDVNSFDKDGYLGVGLGLSFDNGSPFNVKLRLNARFAGKEVTEKGDQRNMDTLVHANLLPCYKISGNVWAYLNLGMSMEAMEEYEGARVSWFVNPYIWVRASEGLRFWTGVQIIQNGRKIDKFGAGDDDPLQWRVPFGFNFYF